MSDSAFGIDHGDIEKAFNPIKGMKAKAYTGGKTFGTRDRMNSLATAKGQKPPNPLGDSNRGLFPKTRAKGKWDGERLAEGREKLKSAGPMSFLN